MMSDEQVPGGDYFASDQVVTNWSFGRWPSIGLIAWRRERKWRFQNK